MYNMQVISQARPHFQGFPFLGGWPRRFDEKISKHAWD
jgi:hypothetical protein